MTIAELFDLSNLFVLPFWAVMILLPNWNITRNIMKSDIPFLVLAGLYIYLISGTFDPETAQALANPDLAGIAKAFSNERVAATGWAHFLALDLFVGRWIYWEGQKTGVWTIHSIALCLFAGPIGLLSHLVTRWLSQRFLTPPAAAPETAPAE
jgi:hypothetical protein